MHLGCMAESPHTPPPLAARRLKEIRGRQGFSRQKLADALQVHVNQIQKLENGERRMTADWMQKIGDVLKVPPNQFLIPDDQEIPEQKLPEPIDLGTETFTAIGKYDVRLSAGPGCLVDPHAAPLGMYLAETQWLRAVTASAPEMLAIVRVDGSSMTPTLVDGDWVLVDRTQTKAAREGIFALAVQDVAWVKRLSLNLREKKIRVISDNTAIPVQDVDEVDLHVIGRVVALVARKVS